MHLSWRVRSPRRNRTGQGAAHPRYGGRANRPARDRTAAPWNTTHAPVSSSTALP